MKTILGIFSLFIVAIGAAIFTTDSAQPAPFNPAASFLKTV